MNENIKPTWDRFYHDTKVFIQGLLADPLSARLSPYLKMLGLSRKQFIKDLLKRSIISREGNVVISNDGASDVYNVKFNFVGRNFERNCHRLFSQYFEKNVPEKLQEEDGGGATTAADSGQFITPMTKPIRRVIMTEKQVQEILEATTCGSVGAFQYDAPGLVLKTSDGKKDPSYSR